MKYWLDIYSVSSWDVRVPLGVRYTGGHWYNVLNQKGPAGAVEECAALNGPDGTYTTYRGGIAVLDVVDRTYGTYTTYRNCIATVAVSWTWGDILYIRWRYLCLINVICTLTGHIPHTVAGSQYQMDPTGHIVHDVALSMFNKCHMPLYWCAHRRAWIKYTARAQQAGQTANMPLHIHLIRQAYFISWKYSIITDIEFTARYWIDSHKLTYIPPAGGSDSKYAAAYSFEPPGIFYIMKILPLSLILNLRWYIK